MADFARKTARDAQGISVRTRRKRRDNECGQVLVEIVGRNDDARTRFSHLASARWIEVYQKDFTAAHRAQCYHFHSSSSKRVAVGASSKRSSSRWRIRLAASPHPARGRAAGEMTMTPLRARISTSSGVRPRRSTAWADGRLWNCQCGRFELSFNLIGPQLRNHEVITSSDVDQVLWNRCEPGFIQPRSCGRHFTARREREEERRRGARRFDRRSGRRLRPS